MKKFTTVEDVAKAAGGLAGHLRKAASEHDAMANHHAACQKAHEGHAAFCKATAEGMADGHEMKAYFGKAHEFHTAKAAHHEQMAKCSKAACEHMSAAAGEMDGEGKTAKAAGEPAPAAAATTPSASEGGVTAMIEATKDQLVKKAISSLTEDPEVAAEIRKMVLAQVQEALGDKIRPDGIHATVPDNPRLQLIPRPGGAEATVDVNGVDPALQHLVEA